MFATLLGPLPTPRSSTGAGEAEQLEIVVRADRPTRKRRAIQEPRRNAPPRPRVTNPSRSRIVPRTSSTDGLAVGCAGLATGGAPVRWRLGARTSSW